MTAISFDRKIYLPLQLQDEVKRLSPSDGQQAKHTNDVYTNNVYTDNVYTNKVKPLEV